MNKPLGEASSIGSFLRNRRARLRPEFFDLPVRSGRRTPGLLRQDVAQLAGISVAYYTLIEQGRHANVSLDVLHAIARALCLTPVERVHLLALCGFHTPDAPHHERAERHPTIEHLMRLDQMATVVCDRWYTVVAFNRTAGSLLGLSLEWPAANLIWSLFYKRSTRELFGDLEAEARAMLGMLRQTLAKHSSDARGPALIDVLQNSPEFRRLWDAYDLRASWLPDEYFSGAPCVLGHTTAGPVRVHRVSTVLPTDEERILIFYTPADDPSVQAFERFARSPVACVA